MHGYQKFALVAAVVLIAGCRSEAPISAPVPIASNENTIEGTVVGDQKTAMEAAVDAGNPSSAASSSDSPRGSLQLAPDAPDSYVVKRGDTLWGIAKVFLRDAWFWPEIWQVNPQIQNPHLIYPGDTLRLVFIDGQPKIVLQRGDALKVEPRVRSQPFEAAVTTIPYETVAAFMSKPSVLDRDQIKNAPYVLATRDLHVVMSDGDTLYARGFTSPAELGSHYNIVKVGDALRDPDDHNRIVGYDGVFTGSGHVTRGGDPTTLIMTESTRETTAGDKLFNGGVDVPLDFIPSAPRVQINGRIMAVANGVTVIGQYEVVVVNRGSHDGLAPGNVLAIYDSGPLVEDTDKKGFFALRGLTSKKVQLPSERTGTFMVFKTFDNMSYGLVMEATNLIRVADKIQNP
jgi:LysM repeat protein